MLFATMTLLTMKKHLFNNLRDILSSLYICINGHKIEAIVEKGVWKLDTISPVLFSTCLEEVYRKINEVLKIIGIYLRYRRFANVVELFLYDPEELQRRSQRRP